MEIMERKREFFVIEMHKQDRVDTEKIFGNRNDIRLEIGSGRGEFLKYISEKEKDSNFIGLEYKDKRINTILKKLKSADNTNVKLCRMIVDQSLANYFATGSISHIYIIHPDPWPKRKHHKKRLISPDFIEALEIILTDNGKIDIITDHCGYALWIIDHFEKHHAFNAVFEKRFSMQKPNDHIDTYFEKKKKAEGLKPIYMQFIKKRG